MLSSEAVFSSTFREYVVRFKNVDPADIWGDYPVCLPKVENISEFTVLNGRGKDVKTDPNLIPQAWLMYKMHTLT